MSVAQPFIENQGPSQLHDHGPWLVCEVAIIHSPHMLVRTTNEQRVLAMVANQWLSLPCTNRCVK